MWRICTTCGQRTNDAACHNDGLLTEVICADTRFPGRLLSGDSLRGQYTIDTLIGVGGMGAVYLAEHSLTHQQVAVKVLWPDLATNPAEVKRFTREARAASVLTHPNTVRVYDFGRDDHSGAIYMVMEYLQGAKLSDVLRDTPVLEPGRVVHIGTQCCKALEEAHTKGLVHRDLKPDNIFLQEVAGEHDFVKVLDFGLAKFVKGDYERDTLTRTGYVVGSPEYMAPEQAIGSEIGPAVDIYSLGIVLYECLTGDLPFDAETTAQVLRKHIMETAPRMFEEGKSPVSAALEQVVMQCLEKDPDARPPSAGALRVQLLKAHDRRRNERDDPARLAREALAVPEDEEELVDDGELEPLVMAPGAVAASIVVPPGSRSTRSKQVSGSVQPARRTTAREQKPAGAQHLEEAEDPDSMALGQGDTAPTAPGAMDGGPSPRAARPAPVPAERSRLSGWTLVAVGAAAVAAVVMAALMMKG